MDAALYSADQSRQQAAAHHAHFRGDGILESDRGDIRIKQLLQFVVDKTVGDGLAIAAGAQVAAHPPQGEPRFRLGGNHQVRLYVAHGQAVVAIHPRQLFQEIRLDADIKTPAGYAAAPAFCHGRHTEPEASQDTLHLPIREFKAQQAKDTGAAQHYVVTRGQMRFGHSLGHRAGLAAHNVQNQSRGALQRSALQVEIDAALKTV